MGFGFTLNYFYGWVMYGHDGKSSDFLLYLGKFQLWHDSDIFIKI